jgi:hypothetical protein
MDTLSLLSIPLLDGNIVVAALTSTFRGDRFHAPRAVSLLTEAFGDCYVIDNRR